MRRARLAAEILGAYVAARRHQRGRPLPETLVRLRAVPARPPAGQPLQIAAGLAGPVVRTLSALPTDARCLARSLVMTRLLARRGVESTLVIGVARDEEFQAHAWVEVEGRPVLPTLEFDRLTEL